MRYCLLYIDNRAHVANSSSDGTLLQLLIDGEFVDSSSGKTFETEDPRTGEVLVEIAEAQEEDVDRAVKAARKVCVPLASLPCCPR